MQNGEQVRVPLFVVAAVPDQLQLETMSSTPCLFFGANWNKERKARFLPSVCSVRSQSRKKASEVELGCSTIDCCCCCATSWAETTSPKPTCVK